MWSRYGAAVQITMLRMNPQVSGPICCHLFCIKHDWKHPQWAAHSKRNNISSEPNVSKSPVNMTKLCIGGSKQEIPHHTGGNTQLHLIPAWKSLRFWIKSSFYKSWSQRDAERDAERTVSSVTQRTPCPLCPPPLLSVPEWTHVPLQHQLTCWSFGRGNFCF